MKKIAIILINIIWIIILLLSALVMITGVGFMSDARVIFPWYYYIWLVIYAVTIILSIILSSKKIYYIFLPLIVFVSPFLITYANHTYLNYRYDNADVNSLCKSIKEQGRRDSCYSDIGIKRKDFSICDMSGMYKGDCYYYLTIQGNDSSLCEKIPIAKDKDYCYREFAKKDNNQLLCNKIIDNVQVGLCNEPFKLK